MQSFCVPFHLSLLCLWLLNPVLVCQLHSVQLGVQTAVFIYADLTGGMLHAASQLRDCQCCCQGKLHVIRWAPVHVVCCTAVSIRLHPAKFALPDKHVPRLGLRICTHQATVYIAIVTCTCVLAFHYLCSCSRTRNMRT